MEKKETNLCPAAPRARLRGPPRLPGRRLAAAAIATPPLAVVRPTHPTASSPVGLAGALARATPGHPTAPPPWHDRGRSPYHGRPLARRPERPALRGRVFLFPSCCSAPQLALAAARHRFLSVAAAASPQQPDLVTARFCCVRYLPSTRRSHPPPPWLPFSPLVFLFAAAKPVLCVFDPPGNAAGRLEREHLNAQCCYSDDELVTYMLPHKSAMVDSLWKLSVAGVEATSNALFSYRGYISSVRQPTRVPGKTNCELQLKD